MANNTHYEHLSEGAIRKEIDRFELIAQAFIESNNYDPQKIHIDESAVFQIISKVDQRKDYFTFFHQLNISDFKELALNCFWIIKLRPLWYDDSDSDEQQKLNFESLNDKFALYMLIKKFRSLANDEQQEKIDHLFSHQYMYELIYSFTYRDISKEAMILLVETMALALGFQPYKQ